MAADPKLSKIWFQLTRRRRHFKGINGTKLFVYGNFHYVCDDCFIYRLDSRGHLCTVVCADCPVVDFCVSGCIYKDGFEDICILLQDGFVCATQLDQGAKSDEGSCEIFDDLLSSSATPVPTTQRSSHDTIHIYCDQHHAQVAGGQQILMTDHHVCVLSETTTARNLVVYGRDTLLESEQCLPFVTYSLWHNLLPCGEPIARPSRLDGDTNVICVTVFPQGYIVATTPYTYLLHKVLYNHLFGLDCNLLSTAGVIVGTSQGQVYAVPVKAHGQSGSPWKFICDMDQPICSIHALTINNNNTQAPSEPCSDCLMIIGNKGKLMIMMCGMEDTVVFREILLAGPVCCSTLDDVNLIYSTGSHIHVVELTDITLVPEKRVVKSVELAYQNICALVAGSKADVSSTKCISVVAVSSLGHVLHITHDLWGDDLTLPRLAGPTGSRLKDLLTAIGQNVESHTTLKSVINEQQTVLAQLAWASLVATQGINSSSNRSKHKRSKSNKSKPILTCSACIETRDLLYKQRTTLVIEIMNHSPHVLSKGWTFVVCLRLNTTDTDATSRSYHKTVPLDNLSSGGSRQMLFELPSLITRDIPLLVQPSVVYHLPDLCAGDKGLQRSVPAHTPDVVVVPLQPLSVDILHFLLPSSSSQSASKPSFSSAGIVSSADLHSLNSAVADVAAHRAVTKLKGRPSAAAGMTSYHSVSIQVTESQYSVLFGNKFDGHAVLKHILHNSRAISVPINTTSIHASSPEGHQMSLHVSPPSSGLGCSVQVSSGDVATLCQTSEAINCRLQVDSGATSKPGPVNSLPLRKCLSAILDFQREVMSLQGALQDGSTDTQQIQQQTLALYEKMRTLQLPS